jgi:hypothetical protein
MMLRSHHKSRSQLQHRTAATAPASSCVAASPSRRCKPVQLARQLRHPQLHQQMLQRRPQSKELAQLLILQLPSQVRACRTSTEVT